MRDIGNYSEKYRIPGFEDYQVRYRRKLVLRQIAKYPHRRILEIGCGMEPLFLFWDIEEQFEKFTVIEPDEIFYDNALRLSRTVDNVECINDYFAPSKKLKDEKYDIIIVSSLLHEIENEDNFLLGIREIASENTIVHINTPNANSFHRILAKEMNLISDTHCMSKRNTELQQSRVYDLNMLRQTAERNQFTVVDSGSYFIKPFTHEQMYSLIQKEIITEAVLDGLFEMSRELPGCGSEIYVDVKKV